MATYKEARKEHLLKSNSRQARFFATKRYDPNKETILMLPGGLASQLERSKKNIIRTGSLITRIMRTYGLTSE